MSWKRSVNNALGRATGLELRRRQAAPRTRRKRRPGDRLVQAPVFVLCTLRSGSTLLRVLLNSHSEIHAPHELHLRYVSVNLDEKWSEISMKELGLDAEGLQYLLWDRLLDRELASSGKRIIADKTPNNVFIADRLRACWPDARFIFLLRHPVAIARSRGAYLADDDEAERNLGVVRRYCEALEQARQTYDGHTVRYEELTADPAGVMKGVCSFLGVRWETSMLDYGEFDHGRMKAGLGDWRDKIKTGSIQPAEPPPAEMPDQLREVAAAWGYTAGTPAGDAPAPVDTPGAP